MASLADTGFFLKFKLKGIFEKDAVAKNGSAYRKVSLRGVYFPKGPADEETRSVFITVPRGHKLPDLNVDGIYTASVDVNAGSDRTLFVTLNTHVPLQADAD